MNVINHYAIVRAIEELTKIDKRDIVDKLLDILHTNELPKPALHDRKNDKTTSYYAVNLSTEDLEAIIDRFVDLELESLTEDGDSTASTAEIVALLDNWLAIKGN